MSKYRCAGCRRYMIAPGYRTIGLSQVCSAECLTNVARRRRPVPKVEVRTRPLAARCQAKVMGICRGQAQHRHHVLRRSQGGQDEDTMDVCRACHDWIHGHVAHATTLGLLRRSGGQ